MKALNVKYVASLWISCTLLCVCHFEGNIFATFCLWINDHTEICQMCSYIFLWGKKKKAWLQKGFGLLCFLTHKHTHRCRRCRDVICTDMFEWSSDRVSEAGNVFNVTPTHLHQKQTSWRQHLFRQAHTERKKRLPYSAKVLIFWYQIFIKNRMEAI